MALIVIAGFALVAASIALWVRNQVLDSEQWADTSVELMRDDQVRSSIVGLIVDRVVDEAGQLADSRGLTDLPALPVIRARTVDAATALLDEPQTLDAWRTANLRAHRLFVAVIDGTAPGADVVIDLSPLVTSVLQRIDLPESVRIDPQAGRVEVLSNDEVDVVRSAFAKLRTATGVLWTLVVVLLLGALFVAGSWALRALAVIGAMLIVVGATLLLVRLIVGILLDELVSTGSAANRATPRAVWDVASDLLRHNAVVTMIVGAGALIASLVISASRASHAA